MTGPDLLRVVAEATGSTSDPVPGWEPTALEVRPQDWLAALRGLHAAGLTYLDWLTAVDDGPGQDGRAGDLVVVAHLATPDARIRLLLRTRCPAAQPTLASAVPVHPGADWHERETYEMFGVVFVGHPNLRALLTAGEPGRWPLRKDAVLAAREVRPWPGRKDPADRVLGAGATSPSRRRQPPPGVRSDWLSPPPDDARQGRDG